MRGDVHVGCGGRAGETHREQSRPGAPVRPNRRRCASSSGGVDLEAGQAVAVLVSEVPVVQVVDDDPAAGEGPVLAGRTSAGRLRGAGQPE